ncbi:hypothetical protein ACWGI1_39425, partial [Streptomyces sp. NPDC054835]
TYHVLAGATYLLVHNAACPLHGNDAVKECPLCRLNGTGERKAVDTVAEHKVGAEATRQRTSAPVNAMKNLVQPHDDGTGAAGAMVAGAFAIRLGTSAVKGVVRRFRR